MSIFTRSISITSITIATTLCSNVATAKLNSEFGSCAAAALETQQLSAKKINVSLPSDNADAMDHSVSSGVREYKMELVNKTSGESLGKFTCRVNLSGEVLSASYLSRL